MFSRSGRISPRHVVVACVGAVALISVFHSASILDNIRRISQQRLALLLEYPAVVEGQAPVAHASSYTLGPPTRHFRDNARHDVRYVTTWPWDGLTNSVLVYHHLLWHAILTRRVAVLPPFKALHIGQEEANLPFGELFDVPRLSSALGIGVIEWRDLKLPVKADEDVEQIGCWSTHMAHHDGRSIHSATEGTLGLDVSQWSVPVVANLSDQPWMTYDHVLAALDLNSTRRGLLADPPFPPAPGDNGTALEPDVQMQCFDFMYRMISLATYKCGEEWQPSWLNVGRHVHFTPRIEDLTRNALRATFALGPDEPIPPFIAIHVRHGDFKDACYDWSIEECFAPLERYAIRVEQIQAQLREEYNIDVKLVLMTSDERNATWWEETEKLGWKHIDYAAQPHDEILGKWYPIIIDSAAQSMAAGFVGTDRSTVSTISALRNHAWSYGVTRTVIWGWPNADVDVPDRTYSQDIISCVGAIAGS